ncbi:beta strand repeat-containing protein, partial [Devosia sp.]|uniref:beta strand repeat-containing protein n=1 Tax=Devosia sp. TaxID=1871048 RepID=UPI0035AF2D81
DGGYAIAWMHAAEANNWVSSVRVFDAAGTPRSNDILLEEGGANPPYPAIAGLADGGFVVAWYALGHPEDDGGYGVYGQRYDAAGVPVGSEFAVANSAAFYETNPSVVGLADGGFAVAWFQELSAGGFPTDNGVWLSTFDAAGDLVTTVHVANQEAPSIATLADGAIVVAYGEGDVAASVFETDGTPRGAPVSLSGGIGLNIFPSTAGLAGGGFVTTWAHYTGGASNYDVWARVVDASGNAGPTLEVATSMDLSSQHGAQVTALADGSFVIAWTSLGEDGSGLGVYGRHYDAGGAPIGPQQLIPGQTLGNQQIGYDMGEIDHGIVQLADGRLLVTWMDGSKDDGGLVARIFAASTAGSGPGAGDEDTAIALPLITAAAADTDGSESLVLRLSGFPAGTSFSLGALDVGSGDWVIDDPADIAALASTPLLATPPANFNGNFELTVTAVSTDSAMLSSGGATDTASTSASFTVIVHPVDDQPSITSDGGGDTAALSRAENGTLVTTVAAADPDGGGGMFTYAIGGGADAALFAIDAGTGVLSFIAAPDYEMPADADGNNVYEVVVSASDGALTDTQTISVTVTDVGGVTINGTNAADLIDATHSPAGQPLPTDEADTINGNGGNDTLWGLAGDDTISGGAGSDTMRGGTGNDTYVVDAAGDVVIENPGEGIDTVLASVSLTLAAEVENLTLTGAGNISGTGNGLDNILTGNGGNNTLNGGLGADQMAGGLGNDIYVVDNAGDEAIEAANEGTDTVQAAITYAIGDNIENLTLTGSASIDGTGNAANNTITGNAGGNTLDGGGGTDTLIGGLGNDTYIVDDSADVVTEAANAGIDTVQFTGSGSYTLSNNVENLVLGADAGGGTGNTLANTITGNASDNQLSGGTGADTMIGGEGNDTYVVDNAGDTIVELADGGHDVAIASVSYTLGAEVEDLILGGSGSIGGTGNDLDNVLTGNTGANTLNGGLGADTMIGGVGNDTYVVDNAGDVVDEEAAGGTGTDTVQASISFDLGSAAVLGDVERLTLTGSASIDGRGNSLNNVITGNSGNNILDGDAGTDTLIGGLGDDTYVTDGGDTLTEAVDAGIDTVISSVNLTLGANLENLILVGAALTGTGNALNNAITGNDLANILSGGLGDDTLAGGLGDDVYVVDSVGDTILEAADAGIDLVQASVSHALAANVENLTLTGSGANGGIGNDLANVITGNAAANTISGAGGNDTLIGGAGADSMAGGTGDDFYVVDNIGDTAVEAADEGTDLVQSSVSFTLGDHVENLTLTGTAALNATGNAGANTLTGNSGNNVLNGGAGTDLMIGGAGNDTYIVDNAADVVDELGNGGAGTDTVQASISFSLADAAHVLGEVERLTLTGTANLNGTGNAANNVITGNSGSNILDGGAGVDTLIGGLGNDTYVVDSVSDIVTEAANAGTDTVQFAGAAGAFVLGANVENLTLVGNAAIDGTGNTLANVLVGNGAGNTLGGGGGNDTLDGGMGADILIGGAGNDTYVVDDAADRVDEATGGSGTDTVRSSVSFSLLADGVHVLGGVESLVLTGTAAISGTGNALDNTLIGNQSANHLFGGAGDDTLIGGGGNDRLIAGLGHDMLFGGAGADAFDFNVADFGGAGGVVANHSDSIFDYSGSGGEGDVLDLAGLLDDAYGLVGGDTAQLLRAVFSGSDVIVEINENAVLNGSAVNTDWSAAFTLHDVADPNTIEVVFAGQTWHLDAGTGLFGL